MARADRLQVTVTVEMTIALDFLAARTGHTRAAQATLMLRQALDRTIKSAAVQETYRRHVATRSQAAWLTDQGNERAVDGNLLEEMAKTLEATLDVEEGKPNAGAAASALESGFVGRFR